MNHSPSDDDCFKEYVVAYYLDRQERLDRLEAAARMPWWVDLGLAFLPLGGIAGLLFLVFLVTGL